MLRNPCKRSEHWVNWFSQIPPMLHILQYLRHQSDHLHRSMSRKRGWILNSSKCISALTHHLTIISSAHITTIQKIVDVRPKLIRANYVSTLSKTTVSHAQTVIAARSATIALSNCINSTSTRRNFARIIQGILTHANMDSSVHSHMMRKTSKLNYCTTTNSTMTSTSSFTRLFTALSI